MKIIDTILNIRSYAVASYTSADSREVIKLVKRTRKDVEMLLSMPEAAMIAFLAKATCKINGQMAEVGVYKGGSAILMNSFSCGRKLYLFDTFEGLPSSEGIHFKGQYNGGPVGIFSGMANVNLCKGLFSETKFATANEKFSIVHLDIDLASHIKEMLEWFYPRMTRGGVIVSHDYDENTGGKMVIDRFFEDKPEIVVRTSGTQCFIIKL